MENPTIFHSERAVSIDFRWLVPSRAGTVFLRQRFARYAGPLRVSVCCALAKLAACADAQATQTTLAQSQQPCDARLHRRRRKTVPARDSLREKTGYSTWVSCAGLAVGALWRIGAAEHRSAMWRKRSLFERLRSKREFGTAPHGARSAGYPRSGQTVEPQSPYRQTGICRPPLSHIRKIRTVFPGNAR